MRFIVGTWCDKRVRYLPGRLHVCLKLGTDDDVGKNQIKSICPTATVYNYMLPGLYEVLVPPNETLTQAEKLLNSNLFRFVELDREGFI